MESFCKDPGTCGSRVSPSLAKESMHSGETRGNPSCGHGDLSGHRGMEQVVKTSANWTSIFSLLGFPVLFLACDRGHAHHTCMWKSKDNFREWVLFVHWCVGSRTPWVVSSAPVLEFVLSLV